MIVTIDGPAGTGKSTTARCLAKRLGFQYLDTGAMYRAVAAECLLREIVPIDEPAVASLARALTITFDGGRTHVNGRDVTGSLRTAATTETASLIAQNPEVRAVLIDAQRQIADEQDIVCEGRDQGTVAFPHADCKFFLTADAHVRAARRQLELAGQGFEVSLSSLLAEQTARDERDASRAVAPLKPADDALVIDTTDRDIESVVDSLASIVRERQC